MRRIKVKAYEVALILRRGALVRVLRVGSYWIRLRDTVRIFDCTKPFASDLELNVLLEFQPIHSLLEVYQIGDESIGLEFRNGLFVRILRPGIYAYWKSPVRYDIQVMNTSVLEVPDSLSRQLLGRAEVLSYLRVHVVENYEEALLFVDGEFIKPLQAGTHYFWNNNRKVSVLKVDTRMQGLEVSGQEILTKDKAALRINFQAHYRVLDIEKALLSTNDYVKQLYSILQMALREFVGTQTLDQVLAKKEEISSFVLEASKDAALELGVEVLSGGIKDVILPGDMKEIMNQVLLAQKRAQANSITRHEETASTRSLLNTAKLMEQNQMLFKLKEMEYMERIAEKVGEITVTGGGKVLDQLLDVFGNGK